MALTLANDISLGTETVGNIFTGQGQHFAREQHAFTRRDPFEQFFGLHDQVAGKFDIPNDRTICLP